MRRIDLLLLSATLAGAFLGAACSDSNNDGLTTGGMDAPAGTGGTGGTTADASDDAASPDTETTGGSGGSDADAASDTSSGGTSGTGGVPVDSLPASSYCMSSVVATGAPAQVDDFEDGNPIVLPYDGRAGEWSFALSPTASMTTPAAAGALSPVDGGVTGKGLHMAGTDTMGWGAGITANLVAMEGTGCYDASAYTGVKLSLKGRAGARVFIIARVATIRAMEATAGPYRKMHVLSANWQEVSLKWSDFEPSWGTPPEPKVVNPRELYSIAVVTAPAENAQVGEFDVWIDNVELTR